MSHKLSPLIRTMAWVVVLTFSLEQVGYASPGGLASVSRSSYLVSRQSVEDLIKDPSQIKVPSDYVTLKEVYKDPLTAHRSPLTAKLIILIEDAHANYSGQKNLSGALDSLMTQYKGLSLVLAEGGTQDGSLTSIKDKMSKKDLKQASHRLLFDGLIAGHEYLNLTSDHDMKIIGIEDKTLYEENLKTYAELSDKRQDILKYLHQTEIAIQRLKNRMYPKELIEYELAAGSLQLTAEPLKQYEKLLALAVTTTPEIEKYKALRQKEQTLNLNTLKPDSKEYQDYLKDLSSLDIHQLLKELDRLEQEAYQHLLKDNKDALILHAIDRYTTLLEKAYQIKMSSEEFTLFQDNEEDFPTESWQGFLNQHLAQYQYFKEMVPLKRTIEESLPILKTFYSLVNQRDKAFIQNTQKILQQEDQQAAFLVSGGYHTEHLTQLLKDNHYSYIILSPKITTETDHTRYEELLLAPIKEAKKQRSTEAEKNHAQALVAHLSTEPGAGARFDRSYPGPAGELVNLLGQLRSSAVSGERFAQTAHQTPQTAYTAHRDSPVTSVGSRKSEPTNPYEPPKAETPERKKRSLIQMFKSILRDRSLGTLVFMGMTYSSAIVVFVLLNLPGTNIFRIPEFLRQMHDKAWLMIILVSIFTFFFYLGHPFLFGTVKTQNEFDSGDNTDDERQATPVLRSLGEGGGDDSPSAGARMTIDDLFKKHERLIGAVPQSGVALVEPYPLAVPLVQAALENPKARRAGWTIKTIDSFIGQTISYFEKRISKQTSIPLEELRFPAIVLLTGETQDTAAYLPGFGAFVLPLLNPAGMSKERVGTALYEETNHRIFHLGRPSDAATFDAEQFIFDGMPEHRFLNMDLTAPERALLREMAGVLEDTSAGEVIVDKMNLLLHESFIEEVRQIQSSSLEEYGADIWDQMHQGLELAKDPQTLVERWLFLMGYLAYETYMAWMVENQRADIIRNLTGLSKTYKRLWSEKFQKEDPAPHADIYEKAVRAYQVIFDKTTFKMPVQPAGDYALPGFAGARVAYDPNAVTVALYNHMPNDEEVEAAFEILDRVAQVDLQQDVTKEILFVVDNPPNHPVVKKYLPRDGLADYPRQTIPWSKNTFHGLKPK